MIEKVTVPGAIELDRLQGSPTPAQVVRVTGAMPAGAPTRAPHRHDYHELLLITQGRTQHELDGRVLQVIGGQVLLIARGQVHQMTSASDDASGVAVRFGPELLAGAAREGAPGWMLATCDGCVVTPPSRELAHALALVELLEDELQRPADARTSELLAASLGGLLALLQRWQGDASMGTEHAASTSPDVALLREFTRLLEAEHHRHHDAGWYAAQLAVTPGTLAAALTRRTGQSTKRLIGDRLMVEAQRLLRYTDLSVQQVAQRLGYDDPLYLSRAFKAHVGVAPTIWREQLRR